MTEQEHVETEVEETSVETNEEQSSDITYEQALDWKQKAERLEKAEKALVDYKKQLKEIKKAPISQSGDPEAIVRKIYSEEKFFDSNPELKEFKEKLTEYTSKGVPLEDAALLIRAKDETLRNRSTTNSLNMSGGDFSDNKTVFTKAELEKMSQHDYNKVRDLIDKGKARIE